MYRSLENKYLFNAKKKIQDVSIMLGIYFLFFFLLGVLLRIEKKVHKTYRELLLCYFSSI
jgi:hypothetical protein